MTFDAAGGRDEPMSSPTPTIRELGARYRSARALAGRGDAGAARADREARSRAARLRHADRRPRARRREGRRGTRCAAATRARCSASPSATRTSTARAASAPRAARRSSPTGSPTTTPRACSAGRRPARVHARQAHHARVRVRHPVPGPSLPARAQSVEPRPHPRRLRRAAPAPRSRPGSCVGATGSDTGGSIRGPASFCGIVGLKPTYGRCSRAGVLTLSWTLDHTGPMARTVEDCAYLLQPLAGHDPLDPASSRAPVDDYVGAARPRRCAASAIGVAARLLLRGRRPRGRARVRGGAGDAAAARRRR